MGLLGCFDIATDGGLEPRSNEDFGQTLGRWGFGAGPYFVLPLLGPSTVRDTVGKLIDFLDLDPVWYIENIPLRNSLVGLRLVDTRASVLPAEKLLDAAAIDRYEFIRDAFLQLRRNLIYDGNPPRLLDPDEEDDAAPKSDAGTSTLLAGQSEEPVRP
jgi:phospholipid-binding lipoprotein MlaA